MHMDAYMDTLRRTLMETSSLGDERTQEVARSLTAAFDPALRLVALQMLTDIADELNSELDDAHVAVVMDGRIVELGTHDELVALGGEYASLWQAWNQE